MLIIILIIKAPNQQQAYFYNKKLTLGTAFAKVITYIYIGTTSTAFRKRIL